MALIEFTPNSGYAGVLTSTKTVSAGSTILVFAWSAVAAYNYSCTVAGAGAGATIATRVSATAGKTWVWLVENVSSGSCTVSVSQDASNAANMHLHAYEFTGAPASSALDAIDVFGGIGTSVYAAGVSGIAIASGSIAVALYEMDRTATITATGYTNLTAASASSWYPQPMTQTFPSGASGERAPGTVSPNAFYDGVLVAVKQSGGGGPSVKRALLLGVG